MSSPKLALMPRLSRIPTVEELSDVCPLCLKLIHPSKIMRLNFRSAKCPHCGSVYSYPDRKLPQSAKSL